MASRRRPAPDPAADLAPDDRLTEKNRTAALAVMNRADRRVAELRRAYRYHGGSDRLDKALRVETGTTSRGRPVVTDPHVTDDERRALNDALRAVYDAARALHAARSAMTRAAAQCGVTVDSWSTSVTYGSDGPFKVSLRDGAGYAKAGREVTQALDEQRDELARRIDLARSRILGAATAADLAAIDLPSILADAETFAETDVDALLIAAAVAASPRGARARVRERIRARYGPTA